ncbi:hypothetical protein CABS03_15349 [Colletotrichum abscissum]
MGQDGERQCEWQRVIESYSKASITGFHSIHSRTSDRGRMYTVRTTMGPACVGQVQKDEVCCQEEATYDQYYMAASTHDQHHLSGGVGLGAQPTKKLPIPSGKRPPC